MAMQSVLPVTNVNYCIRKPTVYPTVRLNALTRYDDREFHERYHFTKENFAYIAELLTDDLAVCQNHNTNPLTPEQQLCVALRYFATGSFMSLIGDCSVASRSTVHRVIHRVTDALCRRFDDFVVFPEDPAKVAANRKGFYDIAGFPGVVGAIDGTHIRLQAPTLNEGDYVNRKGYHSVNVQAICDHRGKFINVVADWPGSAHDSRIFQTSAIGVELATRQKQGILLGDSGYSCKPYLLTPFLATDEGSPKERYNLAHCSTRCVIERTFGRWKRRFHVLHSEIRLTPAKACRVIGACAVLHNIAIDRNDADDDFTDSEGDERLGDMFDSATFGQAKGREGFYLRDRFVAQFFSD